MILKSGTDSLQKARGKNILDKKSDQTVQESHTERTFSPRNLQKNHAFIPPRELSSVSILPFSDGLVSALVACSQAPEHSL